jgi:hypothetical protein
MSLRKIFYDACKNCTDILATVGISNNRKSALAGRHLALQGAPPIYLARIFHREDGGTAEKAL